jgi:uncharacterized protein involved in type VI secretion and phage assembly
MSAHLTKLLVEREPRAHGTIAGVVVGTVTNNHDDAGLNRVKVKLPWLSEGDESPWARVASPMAGNGRGLFFLPEVGDEVLVMFERGDARFPYVIGSLWNGKDKAPGSNADGKNHLRVIRSRSGHVIRFNDEPRNEKFEILDASGKNSVLIDTAQNTIAITSERDIALAAPKGKITISAQTVDIHATGNGSLTTDGTMTVQATNDLAVRGKTVNINC